jgi:hypothetical protein
MERETRLRYSLAIAVSLVLIFDTTLTWFAANGHPVINAQETIPIGIKWLILVGSVVAAVGIAYWAHRAFLDGGISPVDTTWVDFVIIAYALLTMVSLLFVGESFWLLFALFLFALFVFSLLILKRLLNKKIWLSWLFATLVLSVLVPLFLSTLSTAS